MTSFIIQAQKFRFVRISLLLRSETQRNSPDLSPFPIDPNMKDADNAADYFEKFEEILEVTSLSMAISAVGRRRQIFDYC